MNSHAEIPKCKRRQRIANRYSAVELQIYKLERDGYIFRGSSTAKMRPIKNDVSKDIDLEAECSLEFELFLLFLNFMRPVFVGRK